MNLHLVFALLAIVCFLLAAAADGRAGWIGLLFLTVALVLL